MAELTSSGARGGAGAVTAGASAAVANRVAPALIPLPSASERPLVTAAGRANRSVVVGDRVVVTWLDEPAALPHRGVEVWAHLAEVGFDEMPTFEGAEVREQHVVAVVTGFVPNAVDGWRWAASLLADELETGHAARSVGLASMLGALTARMHRALATPSSVLPLPVGWGTAGEELAREIARPDRASSESTAAALIGLDAERPADVQRIHGDLHLGRVLRTRDHTLVTGFAAAIAGDADPADLLRTPMLDLSSLAWSFRRVGAAVAATRPRFRAAAVDFVDDAVSALVAGYAREGEVDHDLLTRLCALREPVT
jgi:maltokinase